MQRGVGSRNVLLIVVGVVLLTAAAVGLYLSSSAPPPKSGTTGSIPGSTTQIPTTTVSVSGMVTTQGAGTGATKVTFAGSPGTFQAGIGGGQYQVSLPAPGTYSVVVHWTGNYSWQSGDLSLSPASINSSAPSAIVNLLVPTPNSKATVSGAIIASGLGTFPESVIFSYGGANYTTPVTNGGYSVDLPNLANYTVFAHWKGSYSWQMGEVRLTLLELNVAAGSDSLPENLAASTPNSVVQISGNVTANGGQTIGTDIYFANSAGNQFNARISGGRYSLQLPNLATYSVKVHWLGAYSWQAGTVSANPALVYQPAGSRDESVFFDIATPNSVVNVTGTVATSGSGTHPTGLVFMTSGLTFGANLSGSHFSAIIPNIANYSVTVQWAGAYSWQGGTVPGGTVGFNLSAGISSGMASFVGNTPNSLITVSGKVTTAAGTTPTLITFTANGQQYTATPSVGTYTIQLPNAVLYSIAINWSGGSQTGVCHPTLGTYDLHAGPGVASVASVDWSC